jgi:hypothetical protein
VNDWLLMMGLIAVLILVLGIFVIIQTNRQTEIRKKHPGHPKGYWLSQGIGIGLAVGSGIGVALGNLAIGVAMGVAIGTTIGASLEKQHEDEMRPLTAEEKKLKKQTFLFAVGTLGVGMVVFGLIYLSVK